jgi:NADH-quinone oxidoreductase subunit D
MEQALGPQKISVTGVPETSHFARALVAADFRMKRLGMGFERAPVDGLPSFLDMFSGRTAGLQNMMPRWWLAPNYEPIRRDAEGLAWELRGSGVKYDVRRAEPYSSYQDFDFVVPVETAGDCYARYLVRMVEFRESIRIVRQALDGLPEGPISSRPGVKSVGQVRVPKGEGYARVEGARGEVGCYIVSDGGPKPYRMKWRGASFSNLAVLPHIVPGHKVADVVAIMGSVDPVFGEVDR